MGSTVRGTKRHLALVSAAAVCALLGLAPSAQGASIGAYTTKGAWSFISAPKLHPPRVRTDAPRKGKLAPGFFFLGNYKNVAAKQRMVGQSGPLILDNRLQPVWFAPVPTNVLATHLKLQSYAGKPALSWWQGVITKSGDTQSGQDVVVDQHYRKLATLTGASGWVLTQHELVIAGTDAWVTAEKRVPMDLRPYGGPANGTVLDSAVQEYDLKTGKLLFTWDAMANGHVPLSDSYAVIQNDGSWDAYHANSIQLEPGGTFLTSLRNTWAGYQVNINTGAIEWILGGKRSTFTLAANAQFQFQHDIELHAGSLVSVFDDHCCQNLPSGKLVQPHPPQRSARGLVLKLDTTHHTATLAGQYLRGSPFYVAFSGNTELLSGGKVVVGWGSRAYFSEFAKSGKLLLDAVLPAPDLSYRAYVEKWVGTPFFPPSGAVRKKNGKSTVYASWDGATQVARWRVLAGNNANHLKRVASGAKTGFETAIAVNGTFKAFKLQALDSKGHVIGTSQVFPKQQGTPGGPPGFY